MACSQLLPSVIRFSVPSSCLVYHDTSRSFFRKSRCLMWCLSERNRVLRRQNGVEKWQQFADQSIVARRQTGGVSVSLSEYVTTVGPVSTRPMTRGLNFYTREGHSSRASPDSLRIAQRLGLVGVSQVDRGGRSTIVADGPCLTEHEGKRRCIDWSACKYSSGPHYRISHRP